MTNKPEIIVVDDPKHDATEAAAVVCHRVSDMPIPRMAFSLMDSCSICGERIWVAPTSPSKPPKICWPCGHDIIRKRAGDVGIMLSKNTVQNAGSDTRRQIKKALKP